MYLWVSVAAVVNYLTVTVADQTSIYVEAKVQWSDCPNLIYDSQKFITRSHVGCSVACSIKDDCVKYMYCKDTGSCLLLPKLQLCMTTSHNSTCVCKAKRSKQVDNATCDCYSGFYGDCCENIVRDCNHEYSVHGLVSYTDSVFVQPVPAIPPFEIYCVFGSTQYTPFMYRSKTTCQNHFNNTWELFKNGFGTINNGYWLGLEKIRALMFTRAYRLFFGVYGTLSFCKKSYGDFSISNESSQYTLTMGNIVRVNGNYCTSALESGVLSVKDRPFSTYDHSTNAYDCPVRKQAAWWFADHPNCTAANVNGPLDLPYPLFFPGAGFENDPLTSVEMGIEST